MNPSQKEKMGNIIRLVIIIFAILFAGLYFFADIGLGESISFLFSGGIQFVIFFFIFGGMFKKFISKFSNQKRLDELKIRGIAVSVEVSKIYEDKSMKINNRYPFRLELKGTDPLMGQEKQWKSPMIMKDPNNYIRKGQLLNLYIDPAKPNVFAIDFGFLPKGFVY